MTLLLNSCGIIKNNQIIKCIIQKFSKCAQGKGENVRDALLIPLQKEKPSPRRKVSVIGGSGQTGAVSAYILLLENYCDEIVMYDIKKVKDKLYAESLDLLHGVSLRVSPKVNICMDMEKTKDSSVLIFNAGVGMKKGQTRLDIAQDNICIYKDLVPPLAKLSPNCVMIAVCNPCDIIAYAAWKYSGFDKNRIMSTGTDLDSSRFRYHIAKRLGINPYSVGGWIIGEHGNSSVPVWSSVHVAGTKLRDIDPAIGTCKDENDWDSLHKQVVKDGPMVDAMKGCTNFAVAQVVSSMARAILTDSKTVHCVSTQIKGLYDVDSDCFLSMPCLLGNKGICEIIQLPLESEEIKKLNKSACALDKVIKTVQFP